MSAETLDENATAIDGILPLFEGQKNYPQLKITVDYSIVEHCKVDKIFQPSEILFIENLSDRR